MTIYKLGHSVSLIDMFKQINILTLMLQYIYENVINKMQNVIYEYW